jgi:hypothetical protein
VTRQAGDPTFDAVVDFDSPLIDSTVSNPYRATEAWLGGDCAHLSPSGHQRLGGSTTGVPLGVL